MASKSRIYLENWLKTIEIDGNHIADIGAVQNGLKGRTKTWNPDSYVVFDLEQPHEVKLNNWVKLDIQEEIKTDNFLDNYKEGFDTVFCLEVMEYIYNPVKALKNINLFLEQKGMLYISFHTLYGLHNPQGEDCTRYTKNGIIKLLQNTGFKVIDIVTKNISEEGKFYLEKFYRAEGMRLDYSNPMTWEEGYLVKAQKI